MIDVTKPASARPRYILTASILASAMAFIDGSVVSVAVPQIRDDLGAGFGAVQWVSNAYMLFLAALILIGGALGDRYGMKTMFSWGIGGFTLASILCAVAPTIEILIGLRALQGVAAAVMIPISMAIISVHTQKAERARALGIWVSASAVAASLGPWVAGLIMTYGGDTAWRWIFAINLPIGLVAFHFLKMGAPADQPIEQPPLDIVGALLVTLAMALLASGFTVLNDAEDRNLAFGLLISGSISFFGAIWWELRATHPMINLGLFRSKAFSGVNAMTFLVWAGLGATTFYLPMVLIVAWKLTPSHAGGIFLPFGLLIALISPLAGRLVDRFGLRLLLVIGPLIVACGHIALGFAVARQDYWTGIIPAVLLLGTGMGLTAPIISTAVMNSVEDLGAGSAAGINNMLARMAGLFAIAGLGAFVSYVYGLIIKGGSLPSDIQGMMIEAGFGERLTGGLYQISTVDAQVVGMNHAMVALSAVVAAAAILAAIVGFFTLPSKTKVLDTNAN